MKVSRIVEILESIAPPSYAEPWDNVGLLIGSSSWEAERLMLTIDLTEAVLREAIDAEAQMIIAYHPPIFDALKSLTDATSKQRIALEAAAAQIAVYSPHTALDAAPDGVTDWLARGLGDGDRRALAPQETLPPGEARKIVTFCPRDAVETIRNALASAGAGQVGDYALCSFEIEGTGTFHGSPDTHPAVGRPGVLERVSEVRLEMVCPVHAIGIAVATLRHFHPYEEPPIEIYALQPRPHRQIGSGRRVVLDQKASLSELVSRIKTLLGVKVLRVAVGSSAPRRYGVIGLCPGAGGALLEPAIAQGCEMFLTGEMRHHDVLAAQAGGCTIVLTGHTNSERGYLRPLRKTLDERLPGITTMIAKHDRDPLKEM